VGADAGGVDGHEAERDDPHHAVGAAVAVGAVELPAEVDAVRELPDAAVLGQLGEEEAGIERLQERPVARARPGDDDAVAEARRLRLAVVDDGRQAYPVGPVAQRRLTVTRYGLGGKLGLPLVERRGGLALPRSAADLGHAAG